MRRLPLKFVILLVIGFVGTLPFVLRVMGDFWWISGPLLLAWTAVLWRWGLSFAADTPEEAKAWSIPQKTVGTLIMLGQSLVGVVLAVFFVLFFITAWFPTILAILMLAVGAFWFGRDPPKLEFPNRATAREPPDWPDPEADPSHQVTFQQPPATLSEWLLHHVSLVLFLGFGALTVFDSLHRHNIALGWPAAAMTLAYAAFIWIHVVSPRKPGEARQQVWKKVLETFMAVVMTVIFLMLLAVVVEAVGKFWVWIVPPVGLLTLVIALTLRSAQSENLSAPMAGQAIIRGGRAHHDRIVS